ncbi:MAG: antA/AntB antirepressor family protein, partial [Culicoidibacterales bacterium]
MCFEENVDYLLVVQKCPTNNPKNPWTEITEYVISLDMAKELSMVQRT